MIEVGDVELYREGITKGGEDMQQAQRVRPARHSDDDTIVRSNQRMGLYKRMYPIC
jgi:hypothetical protein